MPTSSATPTERASGPVRRACPSHAARGPWTAADARARGLTLLELIIVMMILSALFGLGVGAFRNVSRTDQLAVGQVEDALRAARLFARSEDAPATVIVSAAHQRVGASGLRRVANWHFEDAAGTGWPREILHEGGRLVPEGYLGAALELTEQAVLRLPAPPPGFDSPDGFGLDLALRPRDGYRPMTILERPGLWRLDLDEEDHPRLALQLVEGDGTQEYRRVLEDVRLPSDRFTRLTVIFDGRSLHMALDGVRVGEDVLFDRPRRLPLRSGVSLSSGQQPYNLQGQLDELHVWSVVADDRGPLPPEVTLLGGERVVHLDRHGRLDPAFHRAPVSIQLLTDDPPRLHTLTLGLLGTSSRSVEPAPARVVDQAADEAGPAPTAPASARERADR